MKTVDVRTGRLAVEDEGSGPPVLFVHGFPLDHTMWTAQVEALKSRRRAIAPDLRGFGGSGPAGGPATMEIFADEMAGLLDALGVIGPVAFCGLSMGGYVALQFARRHPGRLAKLILCDTRAVADTPEAAKARRELAEKVLREGQAVAAEAMTPKLFGKTTRERRPEVVDAVRRMILSNPPAGIAAALEGMAVRPDMRSFLAEIHCPTLLLVGEEDSISPKEEMKAMAEQIRGSRFVVIPEAGHMAPMEDPDAANREILGFLDETGI